MPTDATTSNPYFTAVFAKRLLNACAKRNWRTLAQAQAAISGMPFTAAGWLAMKRFLADVLIGSVHFPDDPTASGIPEVVSQADVTELADRNVAGGIT